MAREKEKKKKSFGWGRERTNSCIQIKFLGERKRSLEKREQKAEQSWAMDLRCFTAACSLTTGRSAVWMMDARREVRKRRAKSEEEEEEEEMFEVGRSAMNGRAAIPWQG